MRADHDRLTPKIGYEVYDLTEVAIERGQANFKGGEGTWEGGANQIDVGQTLLGSCRPRTTSSPPRRKAATRSRRISRSCRRRPQAQFDASKKGWQGGAPSSKKLATPTEEMDLLEFIDHAKDTINSHDRAACRGHRPCPSARGRRASTRPPRNSSLSS